MSTTAMKDGRVESRTANYAAFWQKDSADDKDVDRDNRLDQYTDVVNGTFGIPI